MGSIKFNKSIKIYLNIRFILILLGFNVKYLKFRFKGFITFIIIIN